MACLPIAAFLAKCWAHTRLSSSCSSLLLQATTCPSPSKLPLYLCLGQPTSIPCLCVDCCADSCPHLGKVHIVPLLENARTYEPASYPRGGRLKKHVRSAHTQIPRRGSFRARHSVISKASTAFRSCISTYPNRHVALKAGEYPPTEKQTLCQSTQFLQGSCCCACFGVCHVCPSRENRGKAIISRAQTAGSEI